MSRSCVVVGAGPAGLAAAYRLANAGIQVTVLESAAEIGGRTRSERTGGFVVNTGAAFVTSFYDATLGLVRELQLEVTPPGAQPSMAATPFGKLPLDLGSMRRILRFPLISWLDKLRAVSAFAGAALRARGHIASTSGMARMDRGGTVEQWGMRTLGRTGYDYLLRSGVEPFFYFGGEDASAALGKALIRHALRWQMQILPAGMGALCDALAQHLAVRTGCHASAVELRDAAVGVHHSGGTVEADYAILALPAPAIARLEGSLPDEDRADLRAVRYAPNILLYFGYERPITVQYPLVTPAGPGRHPIARVRTLSAWAPPWVPEGKELMSIAASSWRSAELLERDPGRIVADLRADAEEIFGRLADPDWVRTYPRPEAVVVPAPGHYRRMQALLRRPRQRIFYAGDWLATSTIESAVRSGLEAARLILRKG